MVKYIHPHRLVVALVVVPFFASALSGQVLSKLVLPQENTSSSSAPVLSKPGLAAEPEQYFKPDTLPTIFACPLRPASSNPWDSLLWYHPSADSASHLALLTVTNAFPADDDSIEWYFVISESLTKQEAAMSNLRWKFTKTRPQCKDLGFVFREVIIGRTDYFRELYQIETENAVQVERGDPIDFVTDVDFSQWVPPSGLRSDGTVRPTSSCSETPSGRTEFKKGCLSSLIIFANEPYKAKVNIFDNLGNFIYSFQQEFGIGECRRQEMANTSRVTPYGRMYDLVWNQKNRNGEYVGSGVYVWNVTLEFENGRIQKFYKKQGILRTSVPEPGCVASML